MTTEGDVIENNRGTDASSVTVVTQNTTKVELSSEMSELVKQSILIYCHSNPEFIKEIFTEAIAQNSGEIVFRNISKEDARKEIEKFIDDNPACKTSDIIFGTNLNPESVMEILKELKREDRVLSKPLE